MTRVFRVLRAAYARTPFDGEGAYRYGGRWSSPGTRLTYASEHQSLAMLEYFVHLDPEDAPDDLALATAEVPNTVSRKRVLASELPSKWRETPGPPELAQIGDEFVKKAETCLLLVPSALAVSENNWLINPQHPEFRQIALNPVEPLRYDARMFRQSRSRRKHPKSQRLQERDPQPPKANDQRPPLRAGCFLAAQRQEVLRSLDRRRDLP